VIAKSLSFVRSNIAKLSVVVFFTLLLSLGGTWFAPMVARSDTLASANCQPVEIGKIYRFLEGQDSCLTPMSDSDIENLTDPFAKDVLRPGNYPRSAKGINQTIKEKLGYEPTTYYVGEGAQIPTTVASRDLPRGLRYTVTWGANENDSKIMMAKLVSTNPETEPLSLIEVMSFDDRTKTYNYYFLRPQEPDFEASENNPMVWAWTGNTSHAQKPQTIGQGCFRCHHNGVPIMREIELPWNNWQSQRATISSTVVPEKVVGDAFFLQRRGAEVLEQVIRSDFQSYYSNWLRERIRKKDDGTINISDVDKMLRHLTTNTTVNFKSSDVQSDRQNASGEKIDFLTGIPPKDTFLADTLFQTALKLDYSPLAVNLPRDKYEEYLKNHEFKLVGTKGFTRDSEKAYEYPGSTYFAFYLPQVAAEDIYVTNRLLSSKIVTDKFVAALLMVDYKNPLFSDKRASLQKYAQQITTGTLAKGVSSVPEDFVAKIKETGAKACNADNFDACSAEDQFLYTWELPDDQWKQLTAKRLQGYVDSVANLEPNERLYRLMGWSIKQRARFASTAPFCNFFESRLLFPESNVSYYPSCPTTTASN
jgi:hypothetical protein